MGYDKDQGVPENDPEEAFCFPLADKITEFSDASVGQLPLVCGKTGSGELLDHSIRLLHLESFFHLQPNMCLARLAGMDLASRYRGPLALIGLTKVVDPCHTVSLDTRDLTLGLDGLIECGRKSRFGFAYFCMPPLPKKHPGVRVIVTAPSMEDVMVPVRHPIFTNAGNVPPLAELAGMKIRSWQYSGISTTSAPADLQHTFTDDWKYIYLCIDTNSPDFGRIPATILKEGANMLVTADDGQLRDTAHLVQLCAAFKLMSKRLKEATGSPSDRLHQLKEFISANRDTMGLPA